MKKQLFILVSLCFAGSIQAQLSFAPAVNYGTGTFPYSVTSADFNGDGKPDLAVANSDSDNVSVLLGSGTGTFAPAVSYGTGTFPYSVTSADFNGDGKPDLAVVNSGSDDVSILLGSGTGTFVTANNFSVGDMPRFVMSADFNGDGKPDLAAANASSGNISILLGSGTGTFAPAVSYNAGLGACSITSADFNGDAILDLAIANYGADNVTILLGTGTGTFNVAANYAAGDYPRSVTSADFNGDGKVDLATANLNSDNISIFLGSGTGTFSATVNYTAGNNPTSIISSDFNGDSKVDLVIANQGSNNLSVLLGNGTGTFAPAVNYGTGSHPYSVTSSDFDGDGKPDLATANYNSNNASVLLNTTLPPPGATLHFDGTNDYVNCGTGLSSYFNGKTAITQEAWIYPTSNTGSFKIIAGNYNTTSNSSGNFYMRQQGNNMIFTVNSTQVNAVNTVTLNTWQHFAGTWDGNTIKLYVNGTLKASVGYTATMNSTANDVYIGKNNFTNEAFQGNIDELRIWNRALCQPEIQNNMNAEIATTAPGLLVSYHFNQGVAAAANSTVTTLTDASGNNYTGTLTNFALAGANSNWITPGAVVSGSIAPSYTPVTVSISSQTNIACNGGSNGAALVSVSGGTPTYLYSWAPSGGTAASATGLATGNYTCTVTDANSCVATQIINITQPTALVTTTAVTNTSCNGGSNGAAGISASGGTGGYSYLWSTGSTLQTITGLMAGVYTATVTDANSCTSIKSVNVTQPTALVTTTAVTNTSCNGGSNGAASINASGGTGSYTYLWSTGSTLQTITGLMAGVYTATVTDANSCTSIKSVNVNQPTALVTTTAVTNTSCNGGSNGAASINASGGTGSYTYLWSTGSTLQTITGLMAGVYTATVTDANSCTSIKSVNVNQPTAIVLAASSNSSTICSGNSTTLTANATGGTGAITYSWVSGPASSITLVSPTSTTIYTVNVTDANSCVQSATVEVTVNVCMAGEALSFDGVDDNVNLGTALSTALTGNNQITAEAWVKPTTTTGPFKIIIGNYATPANAMQFCLRQQGSHYNFLLGDGNISVNSQVFAANTVTIGVWQHVAGTWDGSVARIYINGVLSNTASITYTSFGALTNSVVIGTNSVPEPWSGHIDEARIWNRALCQSEIQNNMAGEIPTSASGLLANYHFNQGIAAANNTNVTTLIDVSGNANTGTLTNMGLNGATSNWSAPGAVTASVTPFVLPSISVNNGTICAGQTFTISPSGANTYSIQGGSTIVNPGSNATYTVIGFVNDCPSNIVSSNVQVNALPTLSVTTTNTLLCTGETATLSVNGASTYTWSTNENSSDIAVSPTVQTTYTVMGIDANGCENTTNIMQDVSLCTGIVSLSNNNSAIHVYPNPNNGLFTLELTTASKVIIYNALGQTVIADTFEAGKHSIDLNNEPTGVYFVKAFANTQLQLVKVIKQ